MHRQAKEVYLSAPDYEANDSVLDIICYNTMLAIARQGHIANAYAFRDAYQGNIYRAEKLHGTLDTRIKQDKDNRSLYEEAERVLGLGKFSRQGSWWIRNEIALKRAEA